MSVGMLQRRRPKAPSQASKRVRNRISQSLCLCLLQSAHGPMFLAVSRADHAFRVACVVKDALLEMVHPFEDASSRSGCAGVLGGVRYNT